MSRLPIPVLVCRVMGLVFVFIGVWGFIDGNRVLIFHVSAAHNIVHLASGLAAVACGYGGATASRCFCLIFGPVYGLVAALGFAGVTSAIDLLHLNPPDNWLHLALAVLFIVAGLRRGSTAAPAAP